MMTSLTPESKNLLDAERLRKLKPGCIFINTARGELVDEAELCRQIQEGRISRAALDVFSEEPPGPDNPLRGLSNTIFTDRSEERRFGKECVSPCHSRWWRDTKKKKIMNAKVKNV